MKAEYFSKKYIPLLFVISLLFSGNLFADTALVLAKNGKTDYVIVSPENPLPMEKLAVRELQDGLRRTTGVNFKTAASGVKKIVLIRDSSLAPQECELECKGNDLFLKGGDRFGIVIADVGGDIPDLAPESGDVGGEVVAAALLELAEQVSRPIVTLDLDRVAEERADGGDTVGDGGDHAGEKTVGGAAGAVVHDQSLCPARGLADMVAVL